MPGAGVAPPALLMPQQHSPVAPVVVLRGRGGGVPCDGADTITIMIIQRGVAGTLLLLLLLMPQGGGGARNAPLDDRDRLPAPVTTPQGPSSPRPRKLLL